MIETLEHPACRICCRAVRADGTPCRRKAASASGFASKGRPETRALPELRRDTAADRLRAGAREVLRLP